MPTHPALLSRSVSAALLVLGVLGCADAPATSPIAVASVVEGDAAAAAKESGCRGNARARDRGAVPHSAVPCDFMPVSLSADRDTAWFGAAVGDAVTVTYTNGNPVDAVIYDNVLPPQVVRVASDCGDRGRSVPARGTCSATFARVTSGRLDGDLDAYYWVTLVDGTGWYQRLRIRAVGN